MKTIICKFKSNGENITTTAIVNDDLSTLSKSKKNEATDIIDDFIAEDEVWILYFEKSDRLGYEVQMKVDKDGNKTFKGHKAITWEGSEGDSIITDSQSVRIIVK